MAHEGWRGAIFLGVGGTILFWLYYLFSTIHDYSASFFPELILFRFIGFFVFGLGSWLIIEAGIRRAKLPPS
jgi:hypothetical protein